MGTTLLHPHLALPWARHGSQSQPKGLRLCTLGHVVQTKLCAACPRSSLGPASGAISTLPQIFPLEKSRLSFVLVLCSWACVLSQTLARSCRLQSLETTSDHLSLSALYIHCWRFTSNRFLPLPHPMQPELAVPRVLNCHLDVASTAPIPSSFSSRRIFHCILHLVNAFKAQRHARWQDPHGAGAIHSKQHYHANQQLALESRSAYTDQQFLRVRKRCQA